MIAKDWIDDAASELVAADLRTGIDARYFGASKQDAKAIIIKHLPFTPGVAYMPVPRCDQCGHWQPRVIASHGNCSLLSLVTPMDFGCVRWEVK